MFIVAENFITVIALLTFQTLATVRNELGTHKSRFQAKMNQKILVLLAETEGVPLVRPPYNTNVGKIF